MATDMICDTDFREGAVREPVSLYIHIPFCLRKCRYCDFLSGPHDVGEQEQYVQALIREIRGQTDCAPGTPADTVFFGGGTPSVLSAEQIIRIMEALRTTFSILPDAEISLEMNPGTADARKLRALKKAGSPIPALFQCCGSEDFLIEPNRQFHRFLEAEGVPHVYRESPGQHDMVFWREYIPQIVEWMFA